MGIDPFEVGHFARQCDDSRLVILCSKRMVRDKRHCGKEHSDADDWNHWLCPHRAVPPFLVSLPCQSFGQLYTRPDRIQNKCDLQTDSRHFTERRIEGHAGRLKGLHKRFEVLDLETDVIDRTTLCWSRSRPCRQEIDFVSVED